MTTNAVGTLVPELTAEHADGTIWVDKDGDLWSPGPAMLGLCWVVVRWTPFAVLSDFPAHPCCHHGPYRAVLAAGD